MSPTLLRILPSRRLCHTKLGGAVALRARLPLQKTQNTPAPRCTPQLSRIQCAAGLQPIGRLRRRYAVCPHMPNLRSSRNTISRVNASWPESDPTTEFDKLQFDDNEQTVLLIACMTGILTGGGILLFSSLIHGIQDLIWDGAAVSPGGDLAAGGPGAVAAGALVSGLRAAVGGFDTPPPTKNSAPTQSTSQATIAGNYVGSVRGVLRSPAKSVAAALTLGSGASLGPEGPSVEIGSSVGRALSGLVKRRRHRGMLLAAGSAAGISAGFGAPIAGVFFAVETVLSKDSTSMKGKESGVAVASLLLASVCANTVAHTDYGVAPLFTVPQYSVQPGELPLYWLLGALCGLLCTAFAYSSEISAAGIRNLKEAGVPAPLLPAAGGLMCGLVSLAYPEIRYQAFDNVDAILQSGFHGAQEYAPALLFQIVVAKVVLTSVCRSSGLVGGLYGPSIFLGAAMGILYGNIITGASAGLVEISPQQAYGLVAVGAVIAGNCRVPLTAILLLFELTHDYVILLPTLGAVGLSYWVSVALDPSNSRPVPKEAAKERQVKLGGDVSVQSTMDAVDLGTLIVGDYVQQAETLPQTSSPLEAVRALSDAQPACLLVVNKAGGLAGCITLETLRSAVCMSEDSILSATAGPGPLPNAREMSNGLAKDAGLGGSLICTISPSSPFSVLDLCARDASGALFQCGEEDSLATALRIMETNGIRYLPVISKHGRRAIGVLDRDDMLTQVQLKVIQAEVERLTMRAPKTHKAVSTEP
eukprot:CAMPEP_0117678160 /NCGR_PEP_ID=MMETSP0804-20121206/17141_1 /TAXON_ID=1074897 /ORGANISM="Tetraselmis astigmatica, Strain CCMP880" /LENGTH=757 /DNA_ID=CAMNT_0005487513 /DNA_START=281 /DNA_END=2555 /DNA_ORIENTATION=-